MQVIERTFGDLKMAMSDHKAKDAAMAAYMKKHPGSFPDSIMRPGQGEGKSLRALAATMGKSPPTAKYDVGMVGGILAARLGYGTSGVPLEYLQRRDAA
jgi:hypothetical protein